MKREEPKFPKTYLWIWLRQFHKLWWWIIFTFLSLFWPRPWKHKLSQQLQQNFEHSAITRIITITRTTMTATTIPIAPESTFRLMSKSGLEKGQLKSQVPESSVTSADSMPSRPASENPFWTARSRFWPISKTKRLISVIPIHSSTGSIRPVLNRPPAALTNNKMPIKCLAKKYPLDERRDLFLLLSNTGEVPRGKQIMPLLSINDSLCC